MTQYSGKVIRKTPVTPTQQSASGVWKLNEQAAAIRNNLWPVPGVPDPISRSVRLRSSASAYFNRTFGTPTSTTRWTWSGWVKRGTLGVNNPFFNPILAAGEGASFSTSNQLVVAVNGAFLLVSTPVYRDPSAWYHIVLASDMGNATASLRFRVYVNGVEITAWATDARASYTSFPYWCQSGVSQNIGYGNAFPAYFDGYLTEVNFVDGQQLTPSSFGTTDTATGAWIPMPYTGTYGTNGFYLNFKDNTSTTTLGYDYSGNSNNWTANNISLTSGSTYDSMLDVPTPWVGYNTGDTSAVTRGNYNTLNPAAPGTGTISNANLTSTSPTTTVYSFAGTILMTTGKWYWEVTATTVNSGNQYPFIGAYTSPIPNSLTGAVRPGADAGVGGFSLRQNGSFFYNGSTSGTITTSFTSGDVIGIAFDVDAQSVTYYKNGSSIGTQGSLGAGPWVTAVSEYNGSLSNHNFGQRPFSYTPPSGFKALNTFNLPTPTITNGANYMAATLYTGNGTTTNLVNAVNGVSFKPDLVWQKNRSSAANNILVDSVRGGSLYLISNSTGADVSAPGYMTFVSGGASFTSSDIATNQNGQTYVAWQWQAGQGTTSSNTSGSITSTVSVNTTAGFSVVTWTIPSGNGTVGHGLGVAPKFYIVKARNAVSNWSAWMTGFSTDDYIYLNGTAGKANAANAWGGVQPTSTTIGTNGGVLFTAGNTVVAYLFAEVAGFSKFGSYTGNGSADGPFVYCGFRPRWILIKESAGTSAASTNWCLYDTARDTYNASGLFLGPNTSMAESNDRPILDFLSNGFKLRNTYVSQNESGGTFIYAAFAENPFKYSNAR